MKTVCLVTFSLTATIGLTTEALISCSSTRVVTSFSSSALLAMPSSSSAVTGSSVALPSSSTASVGARSTSISVPSETARESAVNVEWQFHHEQRRRRQQKAQTLTDNRDDDITSARAVFCGYRYSDDDYNRLKSAEIVD